jgi:hypothetical protein
MVVLVCVADFGQHWTGVWWQDSSRQRRAGC